jgi:hypothetical protein
VMSGIPELAPCSSLIRGSSCDLSWSKLRWRVSAPTRDDLVGPLVGSVFVLSDTWLTMRGTELIRHESELRSRCRPFTRRPTTGPEASR